MLKHLVITQIKEEEPFSLLHNGIYMILLELHGASSNQLIAPLYSETPSVE